MRRYRLAVVTAALFLTVSAWGQNRGWPTFGHDAARDGWARHETKLNVHTVGHMTLLWRTVVKNKPLALAALTAPVVADGVETRGGRRDVMYVGGSSDNVTALNAATGKTIWRRKIGGSLKAPQAPFWLCPNNLNATPVIARRRGLIFVLSATGELYGLSLGTGRTRFGPAPMTPPFAKTWSLNYRDGIVYTTISQGCGGATSGIYAMNTRHPRRPATQELLVQHGFGAGIWGRAGAAIGANGRIFAETGDGDYDPAQGDYGSAVIAAAPGSLRVKDYFAPLDHSMLTTYDLDLGASSPVWFPWRNYDLVAAGSKAGYVYLLNADALGAKDHHTPLYIRQLANDPRAFERLGIWGGLSEWMDPDGRAYVYVPIWGPASKHAPAFPITHGPHPDGSVMAFEVARGADGAPTFRPAWVSRDMSVPDPVAIAGGVVFALSTGEDTQQTVGSEVMYTGQKTLSNAQRAQASRQAELYAFNAHTGKTLYRSGDAIPTFTHFSGLAVADGKVFVVDHNSAVYAFGLPAKKGKH